MNDPCPECGAELRANQWEERYGLDEYAIIVQAYCPACGWMGEAIEQSEWDEMVDADNFCEPPDA